MHTIELITAWLPRSLENLDKCQFCKKVSEHLEKSGKTVEKAYKSGNDFGSVLV